VDTAQPSGEVARHRFTVREYFRMAEVGILRPGDRVERIDGHILDVARRGPRADACASRLSHLLIPRLDDKAIVRMRGPLRLSDHSEPEPDVVLLRARADWYANEDAGPSDALLVIEIVDSTERARWHAKLPLYAQAGIPEVWLVDLGAGSITIYRGPTPTGYAQAIVATGDDVLRPLAFPDLVLSAAHILG
jgi:Uma2 family endonuclease